MQFFEALQASILLITILITLTVRKRIRFKGGRTHTKRILATALVTSMLLLGMLFAGVQSVNGAVPTAASDSGTSFNVTEYVSGTNTTTETYSTQNSYSAQAREANFSIIEPDSFSINVTSGTITISDINATIDYRQIEPYQSSDSYVNSSVWQRVSLTFDIVSEMVNVTEIAIEYITVNGSGTLKGTVGIYNTTFDGKPDTLISGSEKSLTSSGFQWSYYSYSPAINLTKGTYAVVLGETSAFGDSDVFRWYYWLDSVNGNSETLFTYNGTAWNSETSDLPFRYSVLVVNNADISKPAIYSTSDQVNMAMNGTSVGADNSIGFTSIGVFIFSTNTSVVFLKSWSCVFNRSSGTASSDYYVTNTTDTQWNLTYSINAVSGGSATSYSSRYVDITSVPDDWSVDSASVGTPSKPSSDIIRVTFGADLSAYTDAKVTCTAPNYITQLSTSGPVILGNSINLNVTMLSPVDGTVTFRIYNTTGDQVGSNQTDTLTNENTASTTFSIGETEASGTWTAVANFTNIDQDEAGFKTKEFEVWAKIATLKITSDTSPTTTYGTGINIFFEFMNTSSGAPTPISTANQVTYNISDGSIVNLGPTEFTYNGLGSYNFTTNETDFAFGTWWVEVSASTADGWSASNSTIFLTVNKATPSLSCSLTPQSVVLGQSTQVSGDLTGPLGGIDSANVEIWTNETGVFTLNGSTLTIGGGAYSYSYTPPVGSLVYSIYANYTGNENYTEIQSTPLQNLTVVAAASEINCQLSKGEIMITSSVNISGSINRTVDETVHIEYNNGSGWQLIQDVIATSGSYSYEWYPLTGSYSPGFYWVRATWDGNQDYGGAISTNQSLTIHAVGTINTEFAQYNATIDDVISIRFHFYYGVNNLSASLFEINGTSYTVNEESNGWHNISYSTSNLPRGGITYNLTIYVAGSSYYNATSWTLLNLDKLSINIAISLNPSDEVEIGASITCEATVTYAKNDSPVANLALWFNWNVTYANGSVEYFAASQSFETNENGFISSPPFEITSEMLNGNITASVEFRGDLIHAATTESPTAGAVNIVPVPGDGEEQSLIDMLLDYLVYIIILLVGATASIAVSQSYSARKQERLDKERIRRIMVVWESFALYDQTPSEVIAEGYVVDKELISGFFTAIKDMTKEVSGATLEAMMVYPSYPYYFVYTGTFYCVLILSEKPSHRLERKLLCFADVVQDKYGETYTAGLGVPKTRLDLDDEVIHVFGLTPVTALQEVVTISLSYEEIDKLKVSDDVKAAIMAGRVLTDQMEKFSLEELIEATSRALGDMRMAHGAVLEALQLGYLTVLEKAPIPKEEEIVLEIKPEPEIVEIEEKPPKKVKKKRIKEEEFFENYYGSTLSLVDIDLSKDIKEDERLVLKYVRSYNEQVGKGIKGETLIQGLKEEFKDDEKKVIKTLKKTLKTGYLETSPEERPIIVTEGLIAEEKVEPEKIEKVEIEKKKEKIKDEELFEHSYEVSLTLAEIDSEKLDSNVRKVLKYVRSYFDQVGVGITGKNVIEYLQKEFEVDEKKAIKLIKKALKTGYLQ